MNTNKRSKKYGCDGQCYTSTGMCPRVEYCPETRKIELLATIIAMAIMLVIPIVGFIMAIYTIVNYI